MVVQASCCSTDPLRWFCARCRRRRCAAARLSYRERNRPQCVAACSWRVFIGKCGPMESTPWSTAVPLMPAVIAHDESGTDVLDRPGRREAARARHYESVRPLHYSASHPLPRAETLPGHRILVPISCSPRSPRKLEIGSWGQPGGQAVPISCTCAVSRARDDRCR